MKTERNASPALFDTAELAAIAATEPNPEPGVVDESEPPSREDPVELQRRKWTSWLETMPGLLRMGEHDTRQCHAIADELKRLWAREDAPQ